MPDPSTGTAFSVRFTTGAAEVLGAPPAGAPDPLARIRAQIDPALAKAMVDAEPQLLAWLRASQANLVAFTTDPMTALRAALPDFDPALLARIAALRPPAGRPLPDLPGVTLSTFDVSVKADESTP